MNLTTKAIRGLRSFGKVEKDHKGYGFYGRFYTLDYDDIESCKSPFGNHFATITLDDIKALIDGELLGFHDGEYSTFIKLEDDEESESIFGLIKRK